MTKIIFILIAILISLNSHADEQFVFDVTEIQILDNGNKFVGLERGIAKSNDGITIDADSFEYNKNLNVLKANGNVKINDTINNVIIFTDEIIYYKNKELINTYNNSRAQSLNDNLTISAKNFEYKKSSNTIIAEHNVVIKDKINNYKIYAEIITYDLEEEEISTKGKTTAVIDSKYNFESENVLFLRRPMEIISKNNTTITDDKNFYNLKRFRYLINDEKLFGENILISSNYKSAKNDKAYFSSAVINLKTQNFVAKDTEIKLHKDLFDNSENDPRIKGVSSSKNENLIIINKGIFTSCKETDSCPPWSIQASEIKHDQNKKQINYKNALVKLYDMPVLYFPKFFHPDPSVKRQSGFLKPILNNSNVLGSSFTVPYYHILSDESDITLAPIFFDNDSKMLQNEFREVGEKYNFTANFGHTRKYKSSLLNKHKNISYIFSELEYDLSLQSFDTSKFYFNLEKVTDDTFLKIFDTNLLQETTSLKPKNQDSLSSELKLIFDNDNFNLTTGFRSFENLQLSNNDRYQYVLPYYEFSKNLLPNFNNGSLKLSSRGNNDLNNTNQLKSQVINDIEFSSLDYISRTGYKSNFNFKLKNLNSVGKNVTEYKSSPQIELSSLLEFNSSIPLRKITEENINLLTPKISLRANPGDMKNYNSDTRTINTENIFSLNRLGLDDSLEAGKSLTIGIDYRKEKIDNMNKYFELKIASVLRDKEENFIPTNTTLNKKTSNIYGSISNNLSENFNLEYKFALDNNFNELQYNDIQTTLSLNNFVTSFNFIKEINEMGDQNLIKNQTSYKINENNFFTFSTRRNRKLDLTEFYDLIYEYKNDCLTAGVKYKKTYYEDRDLKPTENLFFSITLFPLTTYEQKIDR